MNTKQSTKQSTKQKTKQPQNKSATAAHSTWKQRVLRFIFGTEADTETDVTFWPYAAGIIAALILGIIVNKRGFILMLLGALVLYIYFLWQHQHR